MPLFTSGTRQKSDPNSYHPSPFYDKTELLKTGTFTVRIADTTFGSTVRRFKEGDYKIGEVIEVCHDLEQKVKEAYENQPKHETDFDAVNKFLIKVRQEYFG